LKRAEALEGVEVEFHPGTYPRFMPTSMHLVHRFQVVAPGDKVAEEFFSARRTCREDLVAVKETGPRGVSCVRWKRNFKNSKRMRSSPAAEADATNVTNG